MHSIPLQSRLPTTYRIARIRRETEHVRTFVFPVSFAAKPGQFLMVWAPGVDEIPMSVAFDDGAETWLTFFAVGDCTRALAAKTVGDLVGLRGPFGTHYTWKPGQRFILVAGGYGAAPMYFLARQATAAGCTVDFIVGARNREYLLFLDDIRALPHTTLHIATDDGSLGTKGRTTDVLVSILDALPTSPPLSTIASCGPEMMLKAVSDIATEKRVPAQLSLERYMKCGFGLCGNCVVDPLGLRLCTEGPVVDNAVAVQITELGQYHRDSLGRKQQIRSKE